VDDRRDEDGRKFTKAVADLLASEVYERLTGKELATLKYK
jgi:hypothetical protein